MMWRCNSARRRGTAPPLPRHGRGAGWNWLPGSPVGRAVLRPRARTRPRRDRPPAAPAVNDRRAGVLSPTQGTVSAGELVSEGFTDLRTDLPRQETTRIDMHQMRPPIVTRAARVCPRWRQYGDREHGHSSSLDARHDDNRAGTDSAGSAPARSERIQKRPAVGAGRLHPVGDAIEAVRVDGYERRAAPCARSALPPTTRTTSARA
jgi:hypothetical protein